MAAAAYSPAVGDVVLGTPYAQGVPLPDDFEIGLIYEFNMIDKLFLVQWQTGWRTAALKKGRQPSGKYLLFARVDEGEGHPVQWVDDHAAAIRRHVISRSFQGRPPKASFLQGECEGIRVNPNLLACNNLTAVFSPLWSVS